MPLSFLNANWFRKYPFKATANLNDINGNTIPLDLIVGARIMAENREVFLKKVSTKDGYVSIEVGHAESSIAIGMAKGKITKDNQSIPIISDPPHAFSGQITVGNPESTQPEISYFPNTVEFEPSTVTTYIRPGITKIKHNLLELTGKITFSGRGLIVDTNNNDITFTVIAPQDIASRMDKTSSLLTCANAIIGGINSVTPMLSNGKNNIDIYGVSPVVIKVIGGRLAIGTDDVTVEDVCKKVNLPPQDNSSNAYFTDITTTDIAEWSTWAQYN